MKHSETPPAVGGTSLLVIFAVLCLTVFALLTVSTVQADGRLGMASAKAVRAYYEADCLAEEILAEIRGGAVPDGVIKDGDMYAYECKISDVQTLVVEVQVGVGGYHIMRWQAVSTTEWQEDNRVQVWKGTAE